MSLVIVDTSKGINAKGTVFGAATGPRTIGDLLTAPGSDVIPLTFGGVSVLADLENA